MRGRMTAAAQPTASAEAAGASAREAPLTNGYLPAAAFMHSGPTAIALLDLTPHAAPVVISRPPESRDALMLVRLHGEPLGVHHLPDHAALDAPGSLRMAAQHAFAPQITAHTARHCCTVAEDSCAGNTGAPSATSVAVIVPTGGRAATLGVCLRSLAAIDHPGLEIIVVDNRPGAEGSRETVEHWQAKDGRIRYVTEPRPGSSVARNRGIAATSAQLLAFTDDDVIVDPTWLRWLLAPFADPQVTAVTGMVLPSMLKTPAQKLFENYAGFGKGVQRRRYNMAGDRAADRFLYPYWGGAFGSGNSMAFRRESLLAQGGFDPALGAGSKALAGADIYAMSASILRGGTLVYEPRSICWHTHRETEEALRGQLFNYGVGLTALFTKALLTDPRFVPAVLRSLSAVVRHRRVIDEQAASGLMLPREYVRIQRRGLVRGPARYIRSRRWAAHLALAQAVPEDSHVTAQQRS